ncbi:MAG: tetratricopeptide repeat protein [Chthonomonadetes bacterium]|nr:tetratricopeptide repeat protein [Chthonomonadetes bacterium]
MRVLTLLLAVLYGVASATPASALDKEALRRAVPLPQIQLSAELISPLSFSLKNPTQAQQQLSILRKKLRGNYRDTGILLEMYGLYNELDQDSSAENLLQRVITLGKERVKRAPRDAEGWLHLGMAYKYMSRYDEAEKALLRASRLSPRNWRVWTELASLTMAKAIGPLTQISQKLRQEESDSEQSAAETVELTRQVQRGTNLIQKSEQYLNRAIALAPREPDVYYTRVVLRMTSSTLMAGVLAPPGEQLGLPFAAAISSAVREDVIKLESLLPDNPRVRAGRALFALFPYIMEAEDEGIDWDEMDAKSRADFQQSVLALQRISRSPDRQKATWALRTLAGIRSLVRQFREQAIDDLRRAISLLPKESENYEQLVAILTDMGRTDEAMAIYDQWLKAKDNARARLILSKLLYERGETGQAKQHVQSALRLEPRNVDASLLLSAYLLREGASPQQVQRLLDNIAPLMRESTPKEKRVHYLTLRGVQFALQDNLASARWAIARARDLAGEETETLKTISELIKGE